MNLELLKGRKVIFIIESVSIGGAEKQALIMAEYFSKYHQCKIEIWNFTKGDHLLLSLVQEKGFTLLLNAFSRVADKHQSWSLQIWGEGPQRQALEQISRDLNLSERVRLPGFTRRPFEVLSRADLFAMSSLIEGFPNALCEAMACGLPVVSFNCSSGIREIIRDGVDGLIVRANDPTALASALDGLMANEEERRRLAGKALEVTERFGLNKTMAKWEQLVLDAG